MLSLVCGPQSSLSSQSNSISSAIVNAVFIMSTNAAGCIMSHLGEGVSLGRGLRGYSAFPPTKMLALLAAATVTSAVKVNDSGSNALGCLDCAEELLELLSGSLFFKLVMLRYVGLCFPVR